MAKAYAPRQAVQMYQMGRTVDSADHMRTRVAISEDLPLATRHGVFRAGETLKVELHPKGQPILEMEQDAMGIIRPVLHEIDAIMTRVVGPAQRQTFVDRTKTAQIFKRPGAPVTSSCFPEWRDGFHGQEIRES